MEEKIFDAIGTINKMDALCYAFENTYLNLQVKDAEELERLDKAQSMFYVIWETMDTLKDQMKAIGESCLN